MIPGNSFQPTKTNTQDDLEEKEVQDGENGGSQNYQSWVNTFQSVVVPRAKNRVSTRERNLVSRILVCEY